MRKDSKIYVAGHRGMVGSAIIRALNDEGYANIATRAHAELDLTHKRAVRNFFQSARIDYVFLAAAKVGGIHANSSYPADFIYQNLMIEAHIIEEAHRAGVERLLFLGSSCIYPRNAPQPMKEECLLSGHLEPTNEPYAIAKIAGIKLCESYNRQYGTKYRSVMPTNLYGPHDNYNLEDSHVLPALLRKFHEAKTCNERTVEVWGTGTPKREFLHVDDMASACVFIMGLDDSVYDTHTQPMLSHINVGTGKEMTIAEVAETIKAVVEFKGDFVFNADKPDGVARKLLDVSRLGAMGWKSCVSLEQGLRKTYAWFLENQENIRG